jgi:putative transposase
MVYGNYIINEEKDVGVCRAHKYKVLAENLQKKYSSTRYPAWWRKGILGRIRSYHRKARNILKG